MIERQQIEQAITALEAQRPALEAAIVETSLAALRRQLANLDHRQPVTASAMHGERKQVTVMFADISGFTAMSEKLDPEEVRNMINACFERLGQVIDRYGGHIDKFIGDEIMALFGAPLAHENDPERALRSALEMMRILETFSAEHADKIPKPLALHFGINTGLVIAGGIGTSRRQDYSVMGDAVNLAARLEGLSEPGEILVGEDTYQLTAPLFEFETLKPVKVKGKEWPVNVYRLLRARAAASSQVRGVEGFSSAMVGRQPELAQLKAIQANLQQGHGGLVSIIAEAGLGKSRLVSEFYRSDRRDDVLWAKGHALSHASNASYHIVRQILHSLLGVDSEVSSPELDTALCADVDRLFPNQGAEIYPYLACLLEIPMNEETVQRVKYLEGEALRQRIWLAVENFIQAKTKQIPLILVWDDLHWVDPSSLDTLEILLPLIRTCRLLLILVYRPRRNSRIWTFYQRANQVMGDQHICIELPHLTFEESSQLLNNLLKGCNLPGEMQHLILRKAEGNPFYIEEVIRSLINSGTLRLSVTDQKCIVMAGIDSITIPDTLQGVIMSRIDQLAPDAKRVLQVASVAGRTFSRDVLARIMETTGSLAEQLQNLEFQDLIGPKTGGSAVEYSFKHVFTQESVYQSLLRTDRQALHQKVGEALEAVSTGNLGDQALLLAHHFEQSRDKERALTYLKMAGQNAFAAHANREGKEIYSRALALLDKNDYRRRWEILDYREQTLDRLGEREHQATDLTLMQTLAELIQDKECLAVTHNRRAIYFDKISEYQAADEAAVAGLRMARQAHAPHLEAESLNLLALSAWRRFDYRQVQQWASQALEALKIIGDPRKRIASLLHLGRSSYRLGQYDTALEYIRAAQTVAHETGNRESDAEADLILGWIYQRLGDYDRAAENFQHMLQKCRLIGDRYGEAMALSHLGWLAADRQSYDQGILDCQQALEISQRVSDRENAAYALSGLALNYERLADDESAARAYREALAIHRDIGATTIAIFDQAGLARLALAGQNFEEARRHIDNVSGWILAGNAQQFWDPWVIYLSAYRVLMALGETETAGLILEEAHQLLQQRAKEISSESLRHGFLERVAVNRTLENEWQTMYIARS